MSNHPQNRGYMHMCVWVCLSLCPGLLVYRPSPHSLSWRSTMCISSAPRGRRCGRMRRPDRQFRQRMMWRNGDYLFISTLEDVVGGGVVLRPKAGLACSSFCLIIHGARVQCVRLSGGATLSFSGDFVALGEGYTSLIQHCMYIYVKRNIHTHIYTKVRKLGWDDVKVGGRLCLVIHSNFNAHRSQPTYSPTKPQAKTNKPGKLWHQGPATRTPKIEQTHYV